DDQGAGRHFWLGLGVKTAAQGPPRLSAATRRIAYITAYICAQSAQFVGRQTTIGARARRVTGRRRAIGRKRSALSQGTDSMAVLAIRRGVGGARRWRQHTFGASLAFPLLMARPACTPGRPMEG